MIIDIQEIKRRNNEIDKLKLEKRYFDLSVKYPAQIDYKKAKNFESKMTTGNRYNNLSFNIKDLVIYKNFSNIKYTINKTLTYGVLALGTSFLFIAGLVKQTDIEAYNDNQAIIREYDNELEKYASKFDTKTMSTMEIIMTVMNDVRSNTQYGINENEKEIFNNYRLVLNSNNNIGVCRHMADKFTTIMNMIDPRYEAYNLLVSLNGDCDTLKKCDIDSPISQSYLENINEDEENKPLLNEKIFANHMVSVLKPIDADYYLVVDVTNPSIGVLDNGKIYMFNSNDTSFIEYRPVHQYFGNIDHYGDINKELLMSVFKKINIEELNKIYGLDEQNKILKKIKD